MEGRKRSGLRRRKETYFEAGMIKSEGEGERRYARNTKYLNL